MKTKSNVANALPARREHGDVQAAFDLVAKNCSLSSGCLAQLKLDSAFRKEICSLARTAPDYERHVVQRFLAGDRNPFRLIAGGLHVYDSVKFAEVTSRLHRALGSLRREAELIDHRIEAGNQPDRLGDRLLTLDLIAEHADTLLQLFAHSLWSRAALPEEARAHLHLDQNRPKGSEPRAPWAWWPRTYATSRSCRTPTSRRAKNCTSPAP